MGFVVVATVLIPESCGPLFADPCTDSDDGLIRVASGSDVESVRDELDAGADPNRISDGATPLRCAVSTHQATIVAMLLEAGARPDNPTLLRDATIAGDVEIVRLLLGSGAASTTALLQEAAGAGGADLDLDLTFALRSDGRRANEDEAAAIAELLLAHGADPNADTDGPTPLLWAAYNGRARVTERLLAHGADPNVGGEVEADLIRFAQLPVGNGDLVPQPSGPVVANVPPLIGAAWTGNIDEARALLDAGADPNLASDEAFTAIYAAGVLGNKAMVQLLLDRGAVPVPVVRPGVMTPAAAARAANHPDTAALLDGASR